MEPVNQLNGFQSFGAEPAAPKPDFDMNTFLRLLTVQLVNQNPLEPMNDRDFFAQMAQLGTVNGLDKLRDSQDMMQASSLLGKEVVAVRPLTEGGGADQLVVGLVDTVSVRNGEIVIGVNEGDGIVEVKLGNVREVREPTVVAE